jgi:hypothetical protein
MNAVVQKALSKDAERDVVIRPTKGLFDLEMGNVWRYRELLHTLMMRDIQNIMATVVMMSIKFETSGEGTRPGLPSQESALHGAAKATQTNVKEGEKQTVEAAIL